MDDIGLMLFYQLFYLISTLNISGFSKVSFMGVNNILLIFNLLIISVLIILIFGIMHELVN